MPNSRITVTRSLAMNQDDAGAIIGIKGYLIGKIIRLKPEQRVLLGRDASQCDVVLSGDMVSRVHCSICYDGKKKTYIVNDLSTNATSIGRLIDDDIIIHILWFDTKNFLFFRFCNRICLALVTDR